MTRLVRRRRVVVKQLEATRALRALFEELSASQGVARYKEEFIILTVMLGDLNLAFDAANRSLDEFARLGTVGLTWEVL